MTGGITTIIYPVRDLAKTKALFSALLGAAPAMDKDADGNIIGLLQAP